MIFGKLEEANAMWADLWRKTEHSNKFMNDRKLDIISSYISKKKSEKAQFKVFLKHKYYLIMATLIECNNCKG